MSITLTSATARADGTAVDVAMTTAHGPVGPGSGALSFSFTGTAAKPDTVLIAGTIATIFLIGTIKRPADEPNVKLYYTAGNVHDSDAPPVYLDTVGPVSVVNNSTIANATGVYGDITDIQAEMGKFNELAAADPDNDNDPYTIALHEQKAIDAADSDINTELAMNNFVTPATASLAKLKIIFGKLGAWQLYQIRGLQDDKMGGKFQAKYDQAMKDLRRLIRASLFNPGSPGMFTLVNDALPQSIAPPASSLTSYSSLGCNPYAPWAWGGLGWW